MKRLSGNDVTLRLIKEIRANPASIFELQAACEVSLNAVAGNLERMRKAGLVKFHGFAEPSKTGGNRAARWEWV